MLNLIIRPIMIVAALIAGWFVARDAVNFNVIQLVVALFLLTAIVAIGACWESISDWLRDRKKLP